MDLCFQRSVPLFITLAFLLTTDSGDSRQYKSVMILHCQETANPQLINGYWFLSPAVLIHKYLPVSQTQQSERKIKRKERMKEWKKTLKNSVSLVKVKSRHCHSRWKPSSFFLTLSIWLKNEAYSSDHLEGIIISKDFIPLQTRDAMPFIMSLKITVFNRSFFNFPDW